MQFNHKKWLWVLALVAAISFDQLFWKKSGGINFFLFCLAAVLGGLIPIWLEKLSIPWSSYLLLAPATFFAAMTAFHSEPFTTTMNVLLTLATLLIFAMTLRDGAWYGYTLWNHLASGFQFFLTSFTGGVQFFQKIKAAPEAMDMPKPKSADPKPVPSWRSYLRGVLLALPVVIVLAALLASADPVFNNRLAHLFNWFNADNLGEYIFRLFYVFIIGYFLLSTYYFGLMKSGATRKDANGKPRVTPFLGMIEADIVLGAVIVLFLAFVILQFTYLFGGTQNITVEGFTYAEYARRGFFELLAVVVISLALFYALSVTTKRETAAQRRVFSGLGLILLALIGIILVSAYTRLTLYETAYGFTRLRTLTHIFMVWVGLLLLALAVMDLAQHIEKMALGLIVFAIGFGVTINLVNVDRLIVRENVTRAVTLPSEEMETMLDTGYLYSLSDDATPQLVTFYNDPTLPESIRDSLGGVLACRLAALQDPNELPWQGFHFSRAKSADLLQSQAGALSAYPVKEDQGWQQVEIHGEWIPCGYSNAMD